MKLLERDLPSQSTNTLYNHYYKKIHVIVIEIDKENKQT